MAKATPLKEFLAAEEAARDAARHLPKDWRDGVLRFLATSEEHQGALLRRAEEHVYDTICRRIMALRQIAELIRGVALPDMPTGESALAGLVANDDQDVLLAAVVTPSGWEDSLGALLRQAVEASMEAGVASPNGETRRMHFAKVKELDACLAWLREVHSRGQMALQAQRVTALRATGR